MELQRQSQLAPILTIQPDCLAVYPREAWDGFMGQLESVPALHAEGRRLKRLLLSNSEECPFDAQGRILLKPYQRERAHLEREVVIAGVGGFFEIWDRRRFEEDQARTIAQYPEIATEISKFGRSGS
jgi:MraZ protein